MEWTETLRAAIDYMEDHLREPITVQDVAAHVYVSPFYLQKGFEIVTGYSVSKYLRSRRLYLAALDLAAGEDKVIDVAYRYGFETPESFTKAFSRFHGATPTQIRRNRRLIKPFFPLRIAVSVRGGETMEYTVERVEKFRLAGFQKKFSFDSSYEEIPKFWDEFREKYLCPLLSGKRPETPLEKLICSCRIGEFGVCVSGGKDVEEFDYLIAGRYEGQPLPEGVAVYEFPDLDWAKFPCRGAMPGSLQAVNTQIFEEWLPGSREYEIAMEADVEWYAEGNPNSPDYEAAIWLPVKRKECSEE